MTTIEELKSLNKAVQKKQQHAEYATNKAKEEAEAQKRAWFDKMNALCKQIAENLTVHGAVRHHYCIEANDAVVYFTIDNGKRFECLLDSKEARREGTEVHKYSSCMSVKRSNSYPDWAFPEGHYLEIWYKENESHYNKFTYSIKLGQIIWDSHRDHAYEQIKTDPYCYKHIISETLYNLLNAVKEYQIFHAFMDKVFILHQKLFDEVNSHYGNGFTRIYVPMCTQLYPTTILVCKEHACYEILGKNDACIRNFHEIVGNIQNTTLAQYEQRLMDAIADDLKRELQSN